MEVREDLAVKYTLAKSTADNFEKKKVVSSETMNNYLRQFYGDDLGIYESMFLALMNQNNVITGYVKISQGGIAATLADVRIICKYAVESLACSVIMCHNHPSGNKQPSNADKGLTKKVVNALKIFDIRLLDHLILTEDDYYSFADEGDQSLNG